MNCATTGLAPYIPDSSVPWEMPRIMHFYRRIGFGANIEKVVAARALNPEQLVSEEISNARNLPFMQEPDWAFKLKKDYGLALLESVLQKDGWAREYIIYLQSSGLKGRMELFWHNHFVTRFDIYEAAPYMYQYHLLLSTYALGNFKDFVRAVGLTPAMLIFLNGNQNTAISPNENYARELYELFALGIDNGYTQNDIVETARALTGYTDIPDEWGPIFFNTQDFDDGQKTIFGKTGNWGYDEVIDILFEERSDEIAGFICGKLYRHFINPEPNETIINELAQIFLANDWEIVPVIEVLFKSEHFFDKENFSTIIMGHIENNLINLNELNATLNGLTVLGVYADAVEQGQALFNPVDVAGWPGNRAWINTGTIAYRWNYWESQIGLIVLFSLGYIADMVRQITTEEEDVNIVVQDIVNYFLPQGVQFDSDLEEAIVNFKGEVPENYFVDGTWTINYWALAFQFSGLMKYINRLPEFQLK